MNNKKSFKNADVFAEIEDQHVVESQAGQGLGTTVTTLGCYGVSWAVGNDGNFCTATVECQKNCN